MSDDIAVGMGGQGWPAIGGRVMTPSGTAPRHDLGGRRHPAGALTGRVSFATSDGLLGPGRRLRYRRQAWARWALMWAAVVLLAPLVAGWAWGLLAPALR